MEKCFEMKCAAGIEKDCQKKQFGCFKCSYCQYIPRNSREEEIEENALEEELKEE